MQKGWESRTVREVGSYRVRGYGRNAGDGVPYGCGSPLSHAFGVPALPEGEPADGVPYGCGGDGGGSRLTPYNMYQKTS